MLPGLGILPFRPSFHPAALAWAARAYAAGGTVAACDLAAVDVLARAAAALGLHDGNCRLNPFLGENLPAALTPLFRAGGPNVDTNLGFVAADYTRTSGLQFGGTKYLTWPNVSAAAFSLTSAHQFVYRCTDGFGVDLTCSDSGVERISLFISAYESDNFNTVVGQGRMIIEKGTSVRLCGSVRTAGGQAYYEDGTQMITSTTAGGAVPFSEHYCMGSNYGINLFSTSRFGGYSIGPGMTGAGVAAYSVAWQRAMALIGRAV